jgi:hypothetical protein
MRENKNNLFEKYPTKKAPQISKKTKRPPSIPANSGIVKADLWYVFICASFINLAPKNEIEYSYCISHAQWYSIN